MNEQFKMLWNTLGIQGLTDTDIHFLYDSYTQSGRFYHNLDHIETCLTEFQEVSTMTNTPELVIFAIWYHDVVYDVNRSDNEQKSADIASAVCSRVGISNDAIQEIYDLILITKHERIPELINQKIITDVDLAILGMPPLQYDKYEKAIRKEYFHVSENEFRKGRAGILQTILEKPSIYSLEYFNNKYHQQAVQNIQKAISDLLD